MEKWFCKDKHLEVVNGFTYTGLLFTTRLSFNQMVHELCVKGKLVFAAILSSLHTYTMGLVIYEIIKVLEI